ncbi:MAG: nicotinamide-nucleotide amidohydrolase family protein [Xanthomonadales bacterium]|nr:CinA family protein [Xanthomonadales bacterium]NIX13680.1 nicotinamide-nucleotide amidohydrolase family protein [Xanthomonadales bacterium]
MPDPRDALILEVSEQVARSLQARSWRLATAESCTGGWIAKACTDLAGSSDWFDRGVVSYSYLAKESQLGVIHADLEEHGAVSEEIAAQMALGLRRGSGAEITLSATGIAGPGGGMPNKPVGLVCFAWSVRGGVLVTDSRVFEGDREAVRRQTVEHALRGVLDVLPD